MKAAYILLWPVLLDLVGAKPIVLDAVRPSNLIDSPDKYKADYHRRASQSPTTCDEDSFKARFDILDKS